MSEGMSEKMKASGLCSYCGNDCGGTCEGARASMSKEGFELTKETLGEMQNMKIEVNGDFSQTLEQMRSKVGADLQPRDSQHITVIGPKEYKVLKDLSPEDIEELQAMNEEIQSGEGVDVRGIGYIDGSNTDYSMRDVDKSKKTSYIAIDIPRLAAFREKVGLPPKDFHVTLGFEGGDVHFQVVGEEPVKPNSPKMKDVTEAIPKKADMNFDDVDLPELTFGALAGDIKQRKEKKKPKQEKKKKKEKKAKVYDAEKLRSSLLDLVASGSKTGFTEDQIKPFIEAVQTNPKKVGKQFGRHMREIGKLMAMSEKKD